MIEWLQRRREQYEQRKQRNIQPRNIIEIRKNIQAKRILSTALYRAQQDATLLTHVRGLEGLLMGDVSVAAKNFRQVEDSGTKPLLSLLNNLALMITYPKNIEEKTIEIAKSQNPILLPLHTYANGIHDYIGSADYMARSAWILLGKPDIADELFFNSANGEFIRDTGGVNIENHDDFMPPVGALITSHIGATMSVKSAMIEQIGQSEVRLVKPSVSITLFRAKMDSK